MNKEFADLTQRQVQQKWHNFLPPYTSYVIQVKWLRIWQASLEITPSLPPAQYPIFPILNNYECTSSHLILTRNTALRRLPDGRSSIAKVWRLREKCVPVDLHIGPPCNTYQYISTQALCLTHSFFLCLKPSCSLPIHHIKFPLCC